jgi:hypothetical protein
MDSYAGRRHELLRWPRRARPEHIQTRGIVNPAVDLLPMAHRHITPSGFSWVGLRRRDHKYGLYLPVPTAGNGNVGMDGIHGDRAQTYRSSDSSIDR